MNILKSTEKCVHFEVVNFMVCNISQIFFIDVRKGEREKHQ